MRQRMRWGQNCVRVRISGLPTLWRWHFRLQDPDGGFFFFFFFGSIFEEKWSLLNPKPQWVEVIIRSTRKTFPNRKSRRGVFCLFDWIEFELCECLNGPSGPRVLRHTLTHYVFLHTLSRRILAHFVIGISHNSRCHERLLRCCC